MSVITFHTIITGPMRHNLMAVQSILIVGCILLAWIYEGLDAALAAFYGGAVALVNGWLLAKRVAHAGKLAKKDLKSSAFTLYLGAIQRFLLVLVGLGAGLEFFHLDPVPLLVTFGVAQLAYMIAAGMQIYH